MTITEAFEELLTNWKNQTVDYVKKYKAYKSRFLNNSGKHTKGVSKDKMIEMLENAGYTVIVEKEIVTTKEIIKIK